jgi:hypothetical protein
VTGVVHCHSEFRYAEKPVSFEMAGKTYKIDCVLSECKSENGFLFTVLTERYGMYQLNYDETQDQWLIKPMNR